MFEICHRMPLASSLNGLNLMLVNYFVQHGIGSFAITYYSQHTKTGSKLIYEWASPDLRPWHQHYLDEHYADIDRTLEKSGQSLLPVFWDVHQQLKRAKNKREARIRQESIEFGIDKGLNIVLHGLEGDFLVLVLHQRINETGLLEWEQKQYQWIAITQCYFHYLRKFLLDGAIKSVRLTRREQQCLMLTARGVRVDSISTTLGISQRTVNFHLQNANKKLGVNNKYLAIMRWKGIAPASV
ncbi:helix-turn-helix transcriptional regulator [Legionella micdadei]|uniref:helix-turn-helix transcriptional regulator n=1 Tax=Legionella micdadei TaxID=451 RepID=UPI0009EF7DE9|nr:LuxR family transcriptional regulator [Legionella micdadei]ARH01609.1 LuxR family transcriptional regulator [Legionella micdadei]